MRANLLKNTSTSYFHIKNLLPLITRLLNLLLSNGEWWGVRDSVNYKTSHKKRIRMHFDELPLVSNMSFMVE